MNDRTKYQIKEAILSTIHAPKRTNLNDDLRISLNDGHMNRRPR